MFMTSPQTGERNFNFLACHIIDIIYLFGNYTKQRPIDPYSTRDPGIKAGCGVEEVGGCGEGGRYENDMGEEAGMLSALDAVNISHWMPSLSLTDSYQLRCLLCSLSLYVHPFCNMIENVVFH